MKRCAMCARYTAHLRIPEDYGPKRPAAADLDAGAAKRLAREGHVAGKPQGSAFGGREAGASGGPGGARPMAPRLEAVRLARPEALGRACTSRQLLWSWANNMLPRTTMATAMHICSLVLRWR